MRPMTARQALQLAADRGATLEAVHARDLKSRPAAARRVPRGGILVKADGLYVALELVPNPGAPK